MSHFLSSVKTDDFYWYLTTWDIESERGEELRRYTKQLDDLRGHGAIRWFYDLGIHGEDVEFRDFSSPNKLPSEIVSRILNGDFLRWFGIPPPRILLPDIYIECVKGAGRLLEDYYKNGQPKTFVEFQSLMLTYQAECWSLIGNKENRMKAWR